LVISGGFFSREHVATTRSCRRRARSRRAFARSSVVERQTVLSGEVLLAEIVVGGENEPSIRLFFGFDESDWIAATSPAFARTIDPLGSSVSHLSGRAQRKPMNGTNPV